MGAMQAPAGWYDDPLSPGGKRWWDGTRWTQHAQLPPPAPPAPAPAGLFAGVAGHAGTPLLPPTNEVHDSKTYAAADERTARRRKRVVISSLTLLAGLGLGAVAIGVAVVGAGEPTQTAASGVEATEGSADQEINRLIGQPEDTAGSTSLATSTVSPTTAPQASAGNSSNTTKRSAANTPSTESSGNQGTRSRPLSEVSSTQTASAGAGASTTAAPTTAAPTTEAPTTAAPTTAAPTTAAPTTAAPTTTALTTASCHPAYSPCLPNSPGDAYNCGDLSAGQKPVTVHNPSVDPYRLDSDNDGVGCESG